MEVIENKNLNGDDLVYNKKELINNDDSIMDEKTDSEKTPFSQLSIDELVSMMQKAYNPTEMKPGASPQKQQQLPQPQEQPPPLEEVAPKSDDTAQQASKTVGKRMSKDELLPVTLLSGFLGAGKTTLLKQILRNKDNLKVAVIVNDMGSINIDAEEIKKHKLVQEKTEMVELHNGCICCTLRGDLLKTVKDLSQSDESYDYLVIESTGIAEPLPVAQTFVMDVNDMSMMDGHEDHDHEHDPDFEPLLKYAKLDTLVTVVDTFNVLHLLSSVEDAYVRQSLLGDEEEAGEEEQQQTIANLLVDQIEFANIILLNKTDLVPGKTEEEKLATIDKVRRLCQKLSPAAKIIVPPRPKFEEFGVDQVLSTGMFDMEAAQTSAGWMRELMKPEHTPETEEYGISSFVFRENTRPFHPKRLVEILKGFGHLDLSTAGEKVTDKNNKVEEEKIFAGVVRAKGKIWLANADAYPMDVHVAGRTFEMLPNVDMPFYVAALDSVPRDEWKDHFEQEWMVSFLETMEGWEWDDANGDRSSELICIGVDLNKEAIKEGLESCLLTDEEMAKGKESWKELEDPFFQGKCVELYWQPSAQMEDDDDCDEDCDEEDDEDEEMDDDEEEDEEEDKKGN